MFGERNEFEMYSVRNATSTAPSYLDLEALHVIDAEREDAWEQSVAVWTSIGNLTTDQRHKAYGTVFGHLARECLPHLEHWQCRKNTPWDCSRSANEI